MEDQADEYRDNSAANKEEAKNDLALDEEDEEELQPRRRLKKRTEVTAATDEKENVD